MEICDSRRDEVDVSLMSSQNVMVCYTNFRPIISLLISFKITVERDTKKYGIYFIYGSILQDRCNIFGDPL